MRFLSRSWVIGRGVADFSISSAIALASYMPTQIGSTVSLLTSFRITIGVLLAGSMTRPRIFISTSMANSDALSPLDHGLADKAVGKALGDPHRNIAPRSGADEACRCEIDCLILRTPADDLAPLGVEPFNCRFQSLPY